jgi:rhamnulokinase
MNASVSFLAVDLGASSGRIIDCHWDGDHFDFREIHRFPNAGVRFGSDLHWDVLRIWTEIQNGLLKHKSLQNGTLVGIGVDAWGVDYCLLDDRDHLLGNPFHYRDARTKVMPDTLISVISGYDLFRATGAQTMEINTSFQLASMVAQRGQFDSKAARRRTLPSSTTDAFSATKREIRRETYNTDTEKCALSALCLPDCHCFTWS